MIASKTEYKTARSVERIPVIHVPSTPLNMAEMQRESHRSRQNQFAQSAITEVQPESKEVHELTLLESCLVSFSFTRGLVAKERMKEISSAQRDKWIIEFQKLYANKCAEEEKALENWYNRTKDYEALELRVQEIFENGVFDDDNEFLRTSDGTITQADLKKLEFYLRRAHQDKTLAEKEYNMYQTIKSDINKNMNAVRSVQTQKDYYEMMAGFKKQIGVSDDEIANSTEDSVDLAKDFEFFISNLNETYAKANLTLENGDTERDVEFAMDSIKKKTLEKRNRIQSLPIISSRSNKKPPPPPSDDGMLPMIENTKQEEKVPIAILNDEDLL